MTSANVSNYNKRRIPGGGGGGGAPSKSIKLIVSCYMVNYLSLPGGGGGGGLSS